MQYFTTQLRYFSLNDTILINSHFNLYYNNKSKKKRINYIKNLITKNSEHILKRHYNTIKGPKYDTILTISKIRENICNKAKYLLSK